MINTTYYIEDRYHREVKLTDASARTNVYHSLAGERDLLSLEESNQQERAVPHFARNLADLFFEHDVIALDRKESVLVGVRPDLFLTLGRVTGDREGRSEHGNDVVFERTEHREGNVVRLVWRVVLAGIECDHKTCAAACVDLRSNAGNG